MFQLQQQNSKTFENVSVFKYTKIRSHLSCMFQIKRLSNTWPKKTRSHLSCMLQSVHGLCPEELIWNTTRNSAYFIFLNSVFFSLCTARVQKSSYGRPREMPLTPQTTSSRTTGTFPSNSMFPGVASSFLCRSSPRFSCNYHKKKVSNYHKKKFSALLCVQFKIYVNRHFSRLCNIKSVH